MRMLVAGTLLCVAATGCQTVAPPVRVERTVLLMGTMARFVAEDADRETAVARLERMVRVVEATEAEISTWRDDSLLSQLNRHPVGTPLALSDELCTVLDGIATWHRATGGAFDPAIGPLIDVWDLRGAGRQPDPETLANARARSGLQHLALDIDRCTATRNADVWLDAGAFGKGAALARVRRAEREEPGAWLIDFGGQVAVSSPSAGGRWPVAIAHPDLREIPVTELELAEGSFATSGGSERDLRGEAGTTVGHILDPRSGTTVSRASSITVWHPDALAADILSTALYVMEPDEAMAFAEERGIAVYIVTADAATGEVSYRATPEFADRFLVGERSGIR